MTNEQIVKEKYPEAYCLKYKFYQTTQDYTIYSQMIGGVTLGATAFSEADAWAYAAERVKNAAYK
jgi:Holliday junction resolvasome RuvABC endonuclease subunit